MKATLMIEAAPSVLAQILANLPADQRGDVVFTPTNATVTETQAVTADTGDDDGPVNSAAPAVDASGLPWDERIHAKTKATNTDGTWRARRGVAKETVAQIEAELRAQHAAPTAPQAPVAPTPPMPAAPVPPAPVAPVAPVAVVPPAPVAPTPPVPQPEPVAAAPAPVAPTPPVPQPEPQPVAAPAPVAPQPPADVSNLDYGQFMQRIAQMTAMQGADGKPLIDADYLSNLTQRVAQAGNVSMTVITDLMSHPHLVPYTAQVMQSEGRWA